MLVGLIVVAVIYLLGLFCLGFLSVAFASNANSHIRLSKMSRFDAWKELWIVPIFWPFYVIPALIEHFLFKKEEEDDN